MNKWSHIIVRPAVNSGYLVLFLILMLLSGTAYTEIYKWTDDAGVVHYTQTPSPAGVSASIIPPPPSVNTEQAKERLEARLDLLDRQADARREHAQQEQKTIQDLTEQQRLCQQARDRLASYERPRVSVPGPDGMPRRLDESERQRELQRSRELVQDLCR